MSHETSEDGCRMFKGGKVAAADQGLGGGGLGDLERRREEAGPCNVLGEPSTHGP